MTIREETSTMTRHNTMSSTCRNNWRNNPPYSCPTRKPCSMFVSVSCATCHVREAVCVPPRERFCRVSALLLMLLLLLSPDVCPDGVLAAPRRRPAGVCLCSSVPLKCTSSLFDACTIADERNLHEIGDRRTNKQY